VLKDAEIGDPCEIFYKDMRKMLGLYEGVPQFRQQGLGLVSTPLLLCTHLIQRCQIARMFHNFFENVFGSQEMIKNPVFVVVVVFSFSVFAWQIWNYYHILEIADN
jgi:hypothetical protein